MTEPGTEQSSLQRLNDTGLHRLCLIGGAPPVKGMMVMKGHSLLLDGSLCTDNAECRA